MCLKLIVSWISFYPAVSFSSLCARRLCGSFWFINQTRAEGRLPSPLQLLCPLVLGHHPSSKQVGRKHGGCLSCQPEINHSAEQDRLLTPRFSASLLSQSLPSIRTAREEVGFGAMTFCAKEAGNSEDCKIWVYSSLGRKCLVLLSHPCANWSRRISSEIQGWKMLVRRHTEKNGSFDFIYFY